MELEQAVFLPDKKKSGKKFRKKYLKNENSFLDEAKLTLLEGEGLVVRRKRLENAELSAIEFGMSW